MTDEEVIQRAIDNGWTLEPLSVNSIGYETGMWRREGVGRPYGTFPGPCWSTIDGKRVKVSDGPYTTTAADVMREALADHDDRCQECGRWIEYGWNVGLERSKAPLPYCWDCEFWVDRLWLVFDTRRVFVDQDHGFCTIGPAKTPSKHNGFGGSWWTIAFDDGRVVETCDLWFGGQVPERFRGRLIPTAQRRAGRING
jgi:hypothetical protein